jgi:hypothetical protein
MYVVQTVCITDGQIIFFSSWSHDFVTVQLKLKKLLVFILFLW